MSQEKQIVILDRYIDSSIAYQGFARGLGAEQIINIHNIAPLNILPNKTFYLEIDVETSLKRQEVRGNEKDYFEQEKLSFYKDLIQGYDYCKHHFKDRFLTIRGNESAQKVSETIIKELESIL